jgi:hypothetical protein
MAKNVESPANQSTMSSTRGSNRLNFEAQLPRETGKGTCLSRMKK